MGVCERVALYDAQSEAAREIRPRAFNSAVIENEMLGRFFL